MNNASMLLFVVLVALSVSLTSACDYNVASLTDLTTILNSDQIGWTTVPTICFAAGTYTLTSNVAITASQNWVGPQQGVDPTCGRLINPPCARYTSASTKNATVEAVFVLGSNRISVSSAHVNFTVDGFSISGSFSTFISATKGNFSVTLFNTYSYSISIQADYVTFDHCYFSLQNLGSPVLSSTVTLAIATNCFFYRVIFCIAAQSVTAIGNTFFLVSSVASVSAPSRFENNAFYFIGDIAVSDSFGQTLFKNNTFWSTSTAYAPPINSILDFDSNCFVDALVNSDILKFQYDFNTTSSVFTNNYFGNLNGPQIQFTSPSSTFGSKFGPVITVKNQTDFDFKYVSKRLHFQAPNVCPLPVFSLTVKPHNIKLGETVNITLSFELNPLLVGAGFTPSMFDTVLAKASLAVTNPAANNYEYVDVFPGPNPNSGPTYLTVLDFTTQTSFSYTYTFQPNDLPSNNNTSSSNFYLSYLLEQTTGQLTDAYYTSVYAPVTITPKVPLECYNLSLSINKNVTAGPLSYNFQQLGCSDQNWQIISVNSSNLFSYDNNHNLVINTGANLSGVRLAHYQVSFSSTLVHNVVTKITIVNHNPVINSANFTWTYPRTQQTFPNWNILTNCTDQDGDNVTVVQIQRNRARTNTSVVQLDDFTLHFVPEKVVVSVLPTGEITLTAPSNSNPVTAGAPLVLFWKQSVSFQFQITDGDVIKQYAWGIANIDYVQLNE